MKENDWIIASLNNPEYSPGDLRTLGLNLDNTQILAKEDYLKSDYIKNNKAFQNEEGAFDEKKFDDFYKQSLQKFQTFSEIDTPLQYDMFDYRRYRTDKANVKDPKLRMFQISNPQEFTIGDGWINEINESSLSDRERAQKNEVYDHATGQYLQYTPNENSLTNNPIEWFKDIFKEPLVLAKYDQEGTHIDPFTGKEVKHAKGDLRINDQGKYFYETLDGRSLAGQDVLSGFDTLTVDGEGLNKIDFFDSDGKDKSIGETLMKGAAAIAPLFLPTPLATAYSATLVLRELGKSLPMIDGLFGAITGNNQDTAFTRLANNIAGKMTAATSSTSDYSRDNQLSLENLSNLLVDVALQWGQQKVIAQSIAKLKGTQNLASEAEKAAFNTWKKESVRQRSLLQGQNIADDIIEARIGTEATWKTSNLGQSLLTNAMVGVSNTVEKYNRLGADTSLLYMALVSNTDVYQSMLEAGCTKREAMSVALGSMLGMFSVDKYLGLGEMFFDEFNEETGEKAIRNAIKKEIDKWANPLKEIAKGSDKGNKTALSVLKSKNFLTDKYETFFSALKNHSLTALGKAVGEGMEEVSEELCADMSKQIYEWAAQWKPTDALFRDLTTENVGAFDNAFDNPLWLQQMTARYGMNFLGGVMGGGLFYGVERWKKRNQPKRDTTQDNLVYAIRNNGKDAVLNMLEEYKDLGKLGSTKHSINYEVVNGEKVWLTPSDKNMSQNDFVYNQLKYEILGIDKIINDNELIKSDEELKLQMTLGEARFQRLLEVLDENQDYTKGYINRYQDLVNKFTAIESRIQDLEKSKPDNQNMSELIDADIERLKVKRENLRQQIQDFNSGENAIDYMGMILFKMDDNLNQPFYISNFKSWLKNISSIEDNPHHIETLEDFDKLDAAQKKSLVDAYLKYKNTQQEQDAEHAWSAFKDLRDDIEPELTGMEDKVKVYQSYLTKIHDLFGENSPFSKAKKYNEEDIIEDGDDPELSFNWDDRTLREESNDLLYESRDIIGEGETEEQFNERRQARKKQLQKEKAFNLTRQSYLKSLQEVTDVIENAGAMLDSTTKRHLLNMLDVRQKDIVSDYINNSSLLQLSLLDRKNIKTILETLKSDLSNLDEVKERVSESVMFEFTENLNSDLESILELREQLMILNNSNEDSTVELSWSDDINADIIKQSLLSEVNLRKQFLEKCEELDILTDGKLDKVKLDNKVNEEGVPENLEERLITLFENEKIVEFLGKLEESDIKAAQDKLVQLNPNQLLGFEQIDDVNYRFVKNFTRNSDFNNLDKFLYKDKESGLLSWDTLEWSLNNYGDDSAVIKFSELEYDEDAGVYGVIGNLMDSDKISNLKNKLQDSIDQKFNFFENSVKTDEVFDYITKVKSYKPVENPIIKIIKKLGLSLNRDTKNVEDLLERMSTLLHQQSKDQFILQPNDRDALQEADDLLALAQSFLWSTYNSKTYQYPYPHNQLINSVIEQQKLSLNPLPVLDDEVAKEYWKAIQSLRLEIGQKTNDNETGWTRGSYRYWDAKNAVNKSQKAIRASELSTKIRLNLLEESSIGDGNIFSGVIDLDGKSIEFNLLDGITDIHDDDPEVRLYKIEQLFYNNCQNLLSSYPKLTLQKIFESSNISSIFNDEQSLREQLVSDFNENNSQEQLTPMDKGMYFITLAGLDPQEFYAAQRKFTEENKEIAPLDIQSACSRTAMMYTKSPELYRSGIDWLFKLSGYTEEERLKYYGLFIPGNGGAGKTEVCIKSIASFAENLNITLTCPTEGQKPGLSKVKKGNVVLTEDVVKRMLGDDLYATCINEANKTPTDDSPFVRVNGRNVLKSTIKLKDIGTDVIILDEATHVDTWVHSVLSNYAKQFNIAIINVGDNYQQGKKSKIGETNLNPEAVFIGKTSRLSVTLRDANIQKYENINECIQLLKKVNDIPLADSLDPKDVSRRKLAINSGIEQFKNFKIKYYNRSELNGDIIVDNLKEELLNNINVNGKIAYVGTNSTTFNLIKQKFGDKAVQISSEVDVQGQEFDSVIIDVDWKDIDLNNPDEELTNSEIAIFLKRFYTLSTRGKVSAVFLDKDGVLKKLVKQEEDSHQNTVTNFGQEAIEKFREHFQEKLLKFNIPSDLSGVLTKSPRIISSTEFSEESTSSETEESTTSVETSSTKETTSEESSESISRSSLDETFVDIHNEDKPNYLTSRYETRYSFEGEAEVNDAMEEVEGFLDESSLQQARVYTSAMFAGMYKEVNKNTGNIVYTPKANQESLLEDMAIFVGKYNDADIRVCEVREVSKISDISIPVHKLRKLKSAISFGLSYDAINDTDITDIISKQDYDNIINNSTNPDGFRKSGIKLVLSRPNIKENRFVGLTGLDEKKMGIANPNNNSDDDKNKLVIKVVAEFKNPKKAQQTFRITLGLLADPKTFNNKKDSIRNRLNACLKEMTDEYGDNVNNWPPKYKNYRIKISQYLKSLDAEDSTKNIQDVYSNYVASLHSKFNQTPNDHLVNGELVLDLPGEITFSKTTNLRNIQGGTNPTNTVRFNTYYDYEQTLDVGNKNTHPTFMSMFDGEIVISPIYIYKPDRTRSSDWEINTLAGKPVVFVSSNLAISPNNLKDAWLRQIEKKGEKQVRALILNNVGASLYQLCDPNYRDIFVTESSEGSANYHPFENDKMGRRMLVALWNWRANLLQFDKLLSEKKYNILTQNNIQLNKVLQEMHRIYSATGKNYEEYKATIEKDPYFKKDELKELALTVLAFNEDCNKQGIRQFRLGYGNKRYDKNSSNNTWIIGKILSENVDGLKNLYKSDEAYGIYINRDTLSRMLEMTNELCDLLFTSNDILNKGDEDSFVISFYDEEGKMYKPHQNLREGTNETHLKIFESKQGNLNSKQTHVVKQIPSLLIKILRRSLAYGKTKVNRKGQRYLEVTDLHKGKRGTTRAIYKGKEIRPWEMDKVKYIHLYSKEKNKDDHELITTLDVESLVEYGLQKSDEMTLAKMLDLCFHGTTEEFIDKRMYGVKEKSKTGKTEIRYFVPQATDAYFKYGFFSDPMARRVSGNDKSSYWLESSTSGVMYATSTRVDPPNMTFFFGESRKIKKPEQKIEEKNEEVSIEKQVINYLKSNADTIRGLSGDATHESSKLDDIGALGKRVKEIISGVKDLNFNDEWVISIKHNQDFDGNITDVIFQFISDNIMKFSIQIKDDGSVEARYGDNHINKQIVNELKKFIDKESLEVIEYITKQLDKISQLNNRGSLNLIRRKLVELNQGKEKIINEKIEELNNINNLYDVC